MMPPQLLIYLINSNCLNKSIHIVPLAWVFRFFLNPAIVSHFDRDRHARIFSEVDTSLKLTRNRLPLMEWHWKYVLLFDHSAIGWSGLFQILLRKVIPLAWLRNGLCYNQGSCCQDFFARWKFPEWYWVLSWRYHQQHNKWYLQRCLLAHFEAKFYFSRTKFTCT